MRKLFYFLSLFCISCNVVSSEFVSWNNSNIIFSGRYDVSNTKYIAFGYSGFKIKTRFQGSCISLKISSPENINYFLCIIDDSVFTKLKLSTTDSILLVAGKLKDKIHEVEIIKVTESIQGLCRFEGFYLEDGKHLEKPEPLPDRKIHFIGNSITCGYGIEVRDSSLHFSPETENFYDAYAALTSRILDADWNVVARSGIGVYRNYGEAVSGSTENMVNIHDRVFYDKPFPKWNFLLYQPAVVCVNLGTNDFSENKGDTSLFRINYDKFLDTLRSKYPTAKIVLLMGPMMNTELLKGILIKLVHVRNIKGDDAFTFFEMSAQGSLGYGADWHPSREQARKNAAELAAYISKLTGWETIPFLQDTTITLLKEK